MPSLIMYMIHIYLDDSALSKDKHLKMFSENFSSFEIFNMRVMVHHKIGRRFFKCLLEKEVMCNRTHVALSIALCHYF